MDAVLTEHRFGFLDGVKSVAKFGKILGAQKIMLGKVSNSAFSEAVKISLRIVDIEQASLDLYEVVPIVPRERLKEAASLLSDLIITVVPLRGRIVQIQKDWKDRVDISIGSTDDLKKGTKLEVLQEDEHGSWRMVGLLKVFSVDTYSSKTKIEDQEYPFKKGQFVQTKVDKKRVEKLRKKLV